MGFLDKIFKKNNTSNETSYDTTNYQYALDFKKAFEKQDTGVMNILNQWVSYDNSDDDAYMFLASTIIYAGARVHAGDTSMSVSKLKTLYQKGLTSKYHDEALYKWYVDTAKMFVSQL